MSFYHCYELQIDYDYSCFRTSVLCETVNSLSIAHRKIMRFVRESENIDNFSFWFVI